MDEKKIELQIAILEAAQKFVGRYEYERFKEIVKELSEIFNQ